MQRVRSTADQRSAYLRQCALFTDLDSSNLRPLAGFTSMRAFEPGEVVFAQETPAEGFHVVIEGTVKVCRFGRDGRVQVMHVLGRGEPCGEVPAFQGHRYPAAAIAVGRLRSIYVPRDRFLELCRSRPEVIMTMLAVLSKRLRHFVQLVEDLSLKDVSARLAKYLLDLSMRADGAALVELDTTKTVLASRLGTIAETLSRTFAKMRRRGIIRVQGKKITIADTAGLQALAAGMKLWPPTD